MPVNSSARFKISGRELSVETSPFRCVLFSPTEKRTLWQLEKVAYRTPDNRWHDVQGAEIIQKSEQGGHLRLTGADDLGLDLTISLHASHLDFELNTVGERAHWLKADFCAGPDEHFMGFGQRFDSIDQRGKEIDLWVEDGAQCTLTYFPIPFYISTAGYGLLIDADTRCIARMATHDDPGVVSIRNAAPTLKLTLFPGSTPKEILSAYTRLADRPELPPDWVFGPWKSRDWQTADQPGIQEDVEKQIELGLPATVKLIDARWESAYHTFEFDPAKFPEPQAMIERIHALGSRLVLWISPWMAVDNHTDPNDYYYNCADKGYFVKTPDGKDYVCQLGLNPMLVGSCIDFTNPAAVAWWQDNIRRLAAMGVDGFNTDFGEQIPEDAVFHDGRTGREMHNIYPRLYNEITLEVLREFGPGVLLSRSGWHGSQRLSALWAGDQSSDFAYNSGLRTAIIAGQSAGVSGLPFWGSDIGGYFGNPTDEVYTRWIQLGAFSPIMMIHGAGKREPWAFSEQTLQVYRHYSRLHTDLFPYIKTYADQAARTGIPIMRAMSLEFPGDLHCWGDLAEHQYCFGAELLVAPVHYGFSRVRPIYLPPGTWFNFGSNERFSGGQVVHCPAEIDHIPVFVRAGTILPRLAETPDTLLPASAEGVRSAGPDLRLDIYPDQDGQFTLSDGTRLLWNDSARRLMISDSPISRQVLARLATPGKESPYRQVDSEIHFPMVE